MNQLAMIAAQAPMAELPNTMAGMAPTPTLAKPPAPNIDQTANYNTPLTPTEERAFAQWLAKSGRAQDLADYDLRGAWKADAQAAANGHLPDTWKKPNHPTFSAESIYSGPYATGEEWSQRPDGTWQFQASPANLKYRSPDELMSYFQRVEPGNTLVLPSR